MDSYDIFLHSTQATSTGKYAIFPSIVLTVAYSLFALSEWTLVFLEAGFDAISVFDFGRFELQVLDKSKNDSEEIGPTA